MTEVELCNLALARVGESLINDLEEGSAAARKCALLLPMAVAQTLRSGKWGAARAQARLPLLASPPPFGFARRFRLPEDCLRILNVNAAAFPWQRMGAHILTDAPRVDLTYVRRIPVAQMDPLLAEATAVLLASRLASALKGDGNLAKALLQEYFEVSAAQARSVDAMESRPRLSPRHSAWRAARRAGHAFDYEDAPFC